MNSHIDSSKSRRGRLQMSSKGIQYNEKMGETTQILDNNDVCIRTRGVGKCYRIYNNPRDRLKQALLRNKRKYYEEYWAIRNIDLDVRKGETLGLVGRNGSGKSTLLKLICGTLSPTEGSIHTKGTVAALLELGSGFNPEFTGIENVFLNGSLFGLSRREIEEKLDDIKAFADIGNFVNQPVKTYSSGMLVRLAFAVIAHVDASILIVDEALSVGDAVFGQRCMRFIRKFKEENTLLFVSHDMNAVSSLCERAMWINAGRLEILDNTSTAITAYTKFCLNSTDEEERYEEEIDNTDQKGEDNNILAQKDNNETSKKIEQENEKNKDGTNWKGKDIKLKELENKNTYKYNIDWREGVDYGNLHAAITSFRFLDEKGIETTTPECGQKVRLSMVCACKIRIENFMVGFILRDKTGLTVLGENNIGNKTLKANVSDTIEVGFEFTMPFIAAGAYTLSIAISEGDPDLPTVMHYKPDILVITPMLKKRVVHGVLALHDINFNSEVIS